MQSITPPILSDDTAASSLIGGSNGGSGSVQIQQSTGKAPPPAAAQGPKQTQPATTVSHDGSGAGDVVRDVYKDWVTECRADIPIAETRCQMVHKVVSRQGGSQILVMALGIDTTNGATNAQIAIPLGVALKPGVQIVVGSEYQGHVEIDRCTQQGCIIEGRLTDEMLSAMRRGRDGAVVVYNQSGERVRLPFSLLGFTDAYAHISGAEPKG